MALDFNKIIMESIEETMDSADKEVIQESEEKKTSTESVSENEGEENYDPAIAPAISAGLGALTLRNKVRTISSTDSNINEIDWEDIGDKVGGIAKAGLKAAKKIGGKIADKASDVGEKIADSNIGKKVAEKAGELGDKGSDIGKKIAEKAAEVGPAKIAGTTAVTAAGVGGGIALANKMKRRKEEQAAANAA